MRCLLLLALALPAIACLNDTEVARQDAEFRAGYPDAPATAAAPEPQPAFPLQAVSAFVAGAGLTAFIGAIAWRRRSA